MTFNEILTETQNIKHEVEELLATDFQSEDFQKIERLSRYLSLLTLLYRAKALELGVFRRNERN